MPVIVIGADTELGAAAIEALLPSAGELRAFISDADQLASLRDRGVKVAIGDVSDGSHVGGAALNAFCAVIVATAARDDRERSFAATPDDVVAAWAEGLRDAGVQRAIWIDDGSIAEGATTLADAAPEFAEVIVGDRPPAEVAAEVAALESRRKV